MRKKIQCKFRTHLVKSGSDFYYFLRSVIKTPTPLKKYENWVFWDENTLTATFSDYVSAHTRKQLLRLTFLLIGCLIAYD